MRITVTAEGETLLVEVSGVVDLKSVPEFRDRLLELVRTGSGTIIVNLEGVDQLDSAGIATLVEAGSVAAGRNCRLYLCCLQQEAQKMLEMVGLDWAFETFATLDEALDE